MKIVEDAEAAIQKAVADAASEIGYPSGNSDSPDRRKRIIRKHFGPAIAVIIRETQRQNAGLFCKYCRQPKGTWPLRKREDNGCWIHDIAEPIGPVECTAGPIHELALLVETLDGEEK